MRVKIKSREGASITFALLLFLVCAVISSVVVVAGSTAAGRMSSLAKMDQRYYAVTSASRLLCSVIDGKEINVVQSGEDFSAKETDAQLGLIADASVRLIKARTLGEDLPNRTLDLSAEASALEDAALDCTIIEKMQKDGMLLFTVTNREDDSSKNKHQYSLIVTFSSNIRTPVTDATTGEITTKTTWKLNEVKKVKTGDV